MKKRGERPYSDSGACKAGKEAEATRNYASLPKCRKCGSVLVSKEVGGRWVMECSNPNCDNGVPEVRNYGTRFD